MHPHPALAKNKYPKHIIYKYLLSRVSSSSYTKYIVPPLTSDIFLIHFILYFPPILLFASHQFLPLCFPFFRLVSVFGFFLSFLDFLFVDSMYYCILEALLIVHSSVNRKNISTPGGTKLRRKWISN